MPLLTVPSADYEWDELREFNPCHNPAGSPTGGQFCGKTGLSAYPYEKGSVKIPAFLKQDVLAARRAGIAVYHHQQPEPVTELGTGQRLDPVARSHAKSGSHVWYDEKGFRHYSPRGRVFLSTRGGDYEPTYVGWDDVRKWTVTKTKTTTPNDPFLTVTEEDVVSTFRHEVGHLMDRSFKGGKVGEVLGREIRAWQYAVEASPNHRVSEPMVRRGLMSHAYTEFRKQTLRQAKLFRGYSWEQEEALDRMLRNEAANDEVDVASMQKARKFTLRVLKSLRSYGRVLRTRGKGVRVPAPPEPWFPARTPALT